MSTELTPASLPWLRALIAAGDALPDALRAEILAAGTDAVPALIHVLDDPALASEFTPIHAARLLLALEAPDAIEPLLRALATLSWETILYNVIVCGLPALGERAFAPTMAAFERATDPEYRRALIDILASLGVHDDRVFAVLMDDLRANPERSSANLAEYGDARALPALYRAFDAYDPDAFDNPLFHGQTLIELEDAITTLGGELTPAQQQRLDDVRSVRQSLFDRVAQPEPTATVRRDGPKPGRNDPCPCGSGRKYKKCHGA